MPVTVAPESVDESEIQSHSVFISVFQATERETPGCVRTAEARRSPAGVHNVIRLNISQPLGATDRAGRQ